MPERTDSPQAIPRLIHQTWKTRDVPERWRRFQRTWLDLHPHWEYRLWTDEDNRAFIHDHYPWFLPIFDAYPQSINRADSIRYFLMARYGGVYVDLDFECLRPLDTLLEGHQLVLGLEPDAHAAVQPVRDRALTHIVCNAFLASIPGHPFWDHVTARLVDSRHEPGVLDATATFFLSHAYNDYAERSRVTLLASESLYPLSNRDTHGAVPPDEIRARVPPDAYAIHYWDGSWWREATLRAVHERVRRARGPK